MYGYIYKITNLVDGRIYIGQHKSSRFDEKYWGSSKYLTHDIQELGVDKFNREVLEWCDTHEQLNESETKWILELNANNSNVGYNRSNGGQSNAGFKQTEYQKRVVSDALRGKPKSAEARKKMSIAKTGLPHKCVTKGMISVTKNGINAYIHPDELQQYLTDGWVRGQYQPNKDMKQVYVNRTYIHNGETTKLIANTEIDYYLSVGWEIGRIYNSARGGNISNGKKNAIEIKDTNGKKKYVKFDDVPKFINAGYTPSKTYYKRLDGINKEKTL